MSNIVQITDLNGEQQLQRDNATKAKFDTIRDYKEPKLIYKLLGVELGKLFIADLDANGVPATARFVLIYEAFSEDYNNCIVESRGIKTMMQGFLWFFYARNNPYIIATGGNKVNKDQNSDILSDGLALTRIYNDSINDAKAIQWYIRKNISSYPEYNGQAQEYAIGL